MSALTIEEANRNWDEEHKEDFFVLRQRWEEDARAEAVMRKLYEEIWKFECVQDGSLQMLQMRQMLQAQFTEQGTPHQFHLIR